MFIAPLNYDRFFKKIFSDKKIAKRFLEDVLKVTIEEIEILPQRHRITNEAMVVEFDFRCKINGSHIIIDMQQWYKTDIAKRFYLYHSLSAVLQLENLPAKSISVSENLKKTSKDYSLIEPTYTIIWMADDTLGTNESRITYSLIPENVLDMINDSNLWENHNFDFLLAKRDQILNILGKKTRQLDFLGKNKMVYLFQPNIVKNHKYEEYFKWFHFAEKSRNPNNKEEDFQEFLNDDIFMEMIQRLSKTALKQDDFEYITNFETFSIEYKRWQDGLRSEGYLEGKEEGREEGREEGLEKGREEGLEKGREDGLEKGREEGIEKGKIEAKLQSAEKCLLLGISITDTIKISNLPLEDVQKIAIRLGIIS
jgi:hypothetical protein